MKIRAAFATYVICAVVIIGITKGAALPKTAELAPANAVVLVDIGDFNQLKAKFEKTSVGKFYNDPSMSAFVKNFTTKVR
jgi:hypothetical protein